MKLGKAWPAFVKAFRANDALRATVRAVQRKRELAGERVPSVKDVLSDIGCPASVALFEGFEPAKLDATSWNILKGQRR